VVRLALGHPREHVELRVGEAGEQPLRPGPVEHLGHDLGIEHRPAGGDAPDGVDEHARGSTTRSLTR